MRTLKYISYFLILFGGLELRAEEAVKILLVGDSTTLGALPREVNPAGPHLEGMIEMLAQAQGLPLLEVINAGKGGETAKRLLGSKWYEQKIKPVPGVDYIFVRLGINDWFKCDDFQLDFPVQLKALLAQLKIDHADAEIILSTICRFMPDEECVEVNGLIKQVALDEELALFDLYTPYNVYLLERGVNALNVRQPYLKDIPEAYHAYLKPYTYFRKGWGNKPDGEVVKLNDTKLDPLFGHLKTWYFDRHPNSEGYNLIALETVKFLKPVLGQ